MSWASDSVHFCDSSLTASRTSCLEAPAPPWASRARSFSKAPPRALSPFLTKASKSGDEEGDDDEAADDGPPVLPEAHRPRDDEADRHEEEDDAEGLDGLREAPEEVQKFVHGLPQRTPMARAAVRISPMSEPQRRKVRR